MIAILIILSLILVAQTIKIIVKTNIIASDGANIELRKS